MPRPIQYHSFRVKFTLNRSSDSPETKSLQSSCNIFVARVPTQFFSIGNSENCDFIVEGSEDPHCTFNFQNDALVVLAKAEIRISAESIDKTLQAGEYYKLMFTEKKLTDLDSLLDCKLQIDPDFSMQIEVRLPKENLSLPDQTALQNQYGQLTKINEGDSCLIYLTEDLHIIKVLRKIRFDRERDWLEIAGKIQLSDADILPDIMQINPGPPCHLHMEYFAGEPLSNYIARQGRIEYKEALSLIRRMASGLQAMQQQRYICTTLLPSDILRASDGILRIGGFALSLGKDIPKPYLQYVAPEIINRQAGDIKSAIFSLGVIGYRLLTGKFPFRNNKEYLQTVSRENFIDRYRLQRSSVHITPQISELLESMLSFDAQDRPAPQEILEWLQEISDLEMWKNYLAIRDSLDQIDSRFCLQVVRSPLPQQVKLFAVNEDKPIVIGRIGDIRIAGDAKISRRHAEAIVKKGECRLKDLGSRNGIFLDSQKVSEMRIASGTSFDLGLTTFCFWDCQKIKNTTRILTQYVREEISSPADTAVPPVPSEATTCSDAEITSPLEQMTPLMQDGIDLESRKITSRKLKQFYDDYLPESEPAESPVSIESGTGEIKQGDFAVRRRQDLRTYQKILTTLSGLMLCLAGAILFLAFPQTTRKKNAPAKVDFTPPAKSVPANAPVETAAAEKQIVFSLEARFLQIDRLQISGKTIYPKFALSIEDTKRNQLLQMQLVTQQQMYHEVLSIPRVQEYLQIHTCTPDHTRRSFRVYCPAKYLVRHKLILSSQFLFSGCRQLEKITCRFLTSQDRQLLEKDLNQWEDRLANYFMVKLPITSKNFGRYAVRMRKIFDTLTKFAFKLRGFLLYRFPHCPGVDKFSTAVELAQANENLRTFLQLSRKIWGQKSV